MYIELFLYVVWQLDAKDMSTVALLNIKENSYVVMGEEASGNIIWYYLLFKKSSHDVLPSVQIVVPIYGGHFGLRTGN